MVVTCPYCGISNYATANDTTKGLPFNIVAHEYDDEGREIDPVKKMGIERGGLHRGRILVPVEGTSIIKCKNCGRSFEDSEKVEKIPSVLDPITMENPRLAALKGLGANREYKEPQWPGWPGEEKEDKEDKDTEIFKPTQFMPIQLTKPTELPSSKLKAKPMKVLPAREIHKLGGGPGVGLLKPQSIWVDEFGNTSNTFGDLLKKQREQKIYYGRKSVRARMEDDEEEKPTRKERESRKDLFTQVGTDFDPVWGERTPVFELNKDTANEILYGKEKPASAVKFPKTGPKELPMPNITGSGLPSSFWEAEREKAATKRKEEFKKTLMGEGNDYKGESSNDDQIDKFLDSLDTSHITIRKSPPLKNMIEDIYPSLPSNLIGSTVADDYPLKNLRSTTPKGGKEQNKILDDIFAQMFQ